MILPTRGGFSCRVSSEPQFMATGFFILPPFVVRVWGEKRFYEQRTSNESRMQKQTVPIRMKKLLCPLWLLAISKCFHGVREWNNGENNATERIAVWRELCNGEDNAMGKIKRRR